MARPDQQAEDSGAVLSTGTRAVIAAAATGAAAAYGVQRLRAGHEDAGAGDESGATADQGDDDSGAGKREALTQALSTKVAQAKNAAGRYTPTGRHSTLNTVWEAASDHLLPFAKEAAASLGRTVARKAPDLVRDELMPRFIDGFKEAAD